MKASSAQSYLPFPASRSPIEQAGILLGIRGQTFSSLLNSSTLLMIVEDLDTDILRNIKSLHLRLHVMIPCILSFIRWSKELNFFENWRKYERKCWLSVICSLVIPTAILALQYKMSLLHIQQVYFLLMCTRENIRREKYRLRLIKSRFTSCIMDMQGIKLIGTHTMSLNTSVPKCTIAINLRHEIKKICFFSSFNWYNWMVMDESFLTPQSHWTKAADNQINEGQQSPRAWCYPSELYKELAGVFFPLLTDLSQEALEKGNQSLVYEAALSVPPKPDRDAQLCTNYWPISLIKADTKVIRTMLACKLNICASTVLYPPFSMSVGLYSKGKGMITFHYCEISSQPLSTSSLYALSFGWMCRMSLAELSVSCCS